MRRKAHALVMAGTLWALAKSPAMAAGVVTDDSVKLQDLTVEPPPGYRLFQDGFDAETAFAGFAAGDARVVLYVRRGVGFDARRVFANGARIVKDAVAVTLGRHEWSVLETEKTTAEAGTAHTAAFWATFRGNSYFGYATAATAVAARAAAQTFLAAID